MPLLELSFLGAPKWLLGGVPLQGFATRKTEALLIYLAVNQQVHRRDTLATLFWPDMGEEHTRNNLRRTLSNLRKLVGDHLQIDRYTIAFDPRADYWLDTEKFVALLTSPLLTSPFDSAVPASLSTTEFEEALALYRDDFLAGFYVHDVPDFDEWVRQQREYFHERAIRGLEQLSTYYLQQREIEQGLATTQRWLGLEPWRELVHQQRMQLFTLADRRIDALAQFEHCRTILAEEFDTEPQPETVALYQQIKAGLFTSEQRAAAVLAIIPEKIVLSDSADSVGDVLPDAQHNVFSTLDQSAFGKTTAEESASGLLMRTATTAPAVQFDQGEMPRPVTVYGRFAETMQIKQWLLIERCALVTIVGLGGSGKTTLAAKITRSLTEAYPDSAQRMVNNGVVASETVTPFTHIIWRSLLNAPPLTTILPQWLAFLSGYQRTDLPHTLPEQLTLLFSYLRQQRCLLVLDNLESLLEAEKTAGTFRPGYEEYGLLIQHMGEMEHQSCLLLTSRELPIQAARLERHFSQIRSLTLSGLPTEPGMQILQTAGLSGPAEELHTIVQRYSGNPLALNLIAETIQNFYAGDIAAFLAENPLVFADIRLVLEEQFLRLSALEQELLFWLAISREPLAVEPLAQRFVNPPSKRLLLETLRSLQQRSLLETVNTSRFTLQNVVTEFLTDKLIALLCQELTLADQNGMQHFHRYGLVNAQAKEYIRATQRRLLLEPLARCLSAQWGSSRVEIYLHDLLESLRSTVPAPLGFAAANLLHLELAQGVELSDQDFSRLQIREADLRGVSLARMNLAHADLTGSVFTEIFNVVLAVAFSPDGQLLAAAGTDGTVRLWHVATKQLVGTCPGNGRWIWSLAFSPDGEFLATGCADRVVRLWHVDARHQAVGNVAERQIHRALTGHTDAIFGLCFHPDHQQLASAAADGTIRIWQTHSGEHLQTLDGYSALNCIAYSPDGKLLASAGRDGYVRLWNVADGHSFQILQAHCAAANAVAFHPDGRFLATAGQDQSIHLWQMETGKRFRTFQSNTSELFCISFHPDGHTLAVNERDHSIRLWAIESGDIVRTLWGHSGTVHTFAFSPDGEMLVSGGWDRTIRFWDTHSGDALHAIQGYRNDIESIAFTNTLHSTAHYLANGNTDGQITLWEVEAGKQIQTLKGHSGVVHTVAFHPDGKRLASGSADQTIRLWPIDKRQSSPMQTLWGHRDEVTAVVFSADGDFWASAGTDQMIRIWHTETGKIRRILWGHTSRINTLCFCCTARQMPQLLISGDDESNLYAWDITPIEDWDDTIAERTRPDYLLTKVPLNGIHTVAFSPHGCALAAGGAEPIIQLWSMPDCRPLHTIQGHTSSIYGLAFSPNGKLLASGSGDQTISLWNTRTGQQEQTLRGHQGVVKSVLFHPAGHRLISSSSDETIKIWDLQSGQCLQTLLPARPYDGLDITGVTGITPAQQTALKALGAVENEC